MHRTLHPAGGALYALDIERGPLLIIFIENYIVASARTRTVSIAHHVSTAIRVRAPNVSIARRCFVMRFADAERSFRREALNK